MIKTSLFAATALAALFLALPSADAAGAFRAWVSGHGTDTSTCGAPTAPCRTLQYVHDNIIGAGGEIDVLDPAGYGAVTITKALSIVNDGVGTAGVQQGTAGENAVTINAGSSDVVTLRGLNIDGLGSGANGIVFNSGAGLTIVNCVIRHFAHQAVASPAQVQVSSGNGVLIQPASGSVSLLISNVITSDNALAGVLFQPNGGPSVTGAIDRLIAVNNDFGILINGGNDTAPASIALANSVASNNSVGISVQANAALAVSIDNTSVSGNGADGLDAQGPATIRLGRSVIVSNANDGVNNATSPNAFYTYGDNRINGNGTDVVGALLTSSPR